MLFINESTANISYDAAHKGLDKARRNLRNWHYTIAIALIVSFPTVWIGASAFVVTCLTCTADRSTSRPQQVG